MLLGSACALYPFVDYAETFQRDCNLVCPLHCFAAVCSIMPDVQKKRPAGVKAKEGQAKAMKVAGVDDLLGAAAADSAGVVCEAFGVKREATVAGGCSAEPDKKAIGSFDENEIDFDVGEDEEPTVEEEEIPAGQQSRSGSEPEGGPDSEQEAKQTEEKSPETTKGRGRGRGKKATGSGRGGGDGISKGRGKKGGVTKAKEDETANAQAKAQAKAQGKAKGKATAKTKATAPDTKGGGNTNTTSVVALAEETTKRDPPRLSLESTNSKQKRENLGSSFVPSTLTW